MFVLGLYVVIVQVHTVCHEAGRQLKYTDCIMGFILLKSHDI